MMNNRASEILRGIVALNVLINIPAIRLIDLKYTGADEIFIFPLAFINIVARGEGLNVDVSVLEFKGNEQDVAAADEKWILAINGGHDKG